VAGRAQSHGNTISKKVWIKASPGVVYKALTEARELVHWFCDHAFCDSHEGSELVVRWRTGKTTQKGRARFTRVVPGKALELLWTEDCGETPETASHHTLSYEIRSKSGMTELIMTDKDDVVSDEETYSFLDQGWNSVLMELKEYCERRERSVKLQPRQEEKRSKTP
jgi:uncharacterized protein YndB with AHSA1/START domain